MLEFNPPKWSWKRINNRFIIDSILSEIWLSGDIKQETVRLMDKREKLPQEAIRKFLLEKWLNQNQVNMLVEYMNCTIQDLKKKFPSFKTLNEFNKQIYYSIIK